MEGQRAYLETVLDRLSSGVLTFDATHKLRTANPAAGKILGNELQQLTGAPLLSMAAKSTVLRQFVDALRQPLTETQQEWRGELTLSGTGGRKVLISRVTPFAQPNGRKGHIVLLEDVTALISAQRDAAWGEVARRLAHEIKNPLTPIQLSAERLRRKYLKKMPAEDAEVLDRATHTIVQQVEAMKTMVNDFSEYARPPKVELKALEADRLIDEIVDLYRGGDKTVAFKAELTAPGVMVEMDPLRVRQMVHNLVKNAQEAVAGQEVGKVKVITQQVLHDEQPYYEMRFQDNGPGFNEAMLQHLFEPYVTTKYKGTGLGLAIVKKIVEEHGGNIWAENCRNGACLVVQFPMLDAVEDKN